VKGDLRQRGLGKGHCGVNAYLCAKVPRSSLRFRERNPMYPYGAQGISLQATLSSASAMTTKAVRPHHPITCAGGELFYDEDNTFRCEHVSVPADDERTQHCVNHSIALLLVELALAL
jgi:hypothetical protein